MDNKNKTALDALTALIANEESLIQGAQGKIESMKIAQDIINGIYTADVSWRDTEVQKASDAVAQEVSGLHTKVDDTQNLLDTANENVALRTSDMTSLASQLQVEHDAHLADNTEKDAQILALTPVPEVAL